MAYPLLIDIERRYPGGSTVRARIDALLPGVVTVLFGPSGAGKSTTLRCAAGLERPDAGTVRCGGTVWSDPTTFLPPQARGIGFLFQDYALFPHLTVAENVGYGVRDRAARAAVVTRLLTRFGLDGLATRRPHEISGGQAQRVALARALAPGPAVLLLDEPLSALDGATRGQLRRELRAVLTQLEVPILIVTHDRAEALALGDRLVLLADGRVVQDGPCADVFAYPASATAARVLGVENVWSGEAGEAGVQVGSLRFASTGDWRGPVAVCVHAEDVAIVAPGTPGCLAGRVTAWESEGHVARVTVAAGVEVIARVPAASQLAVGASVTIHIPPGRIRLAAP